MILYKMKHLKTLRLLFFIFLFTAAATYAQQSSDGDIPTSFGADFFLQKLPPVEILIDSAISRAPAIKGQEISARKSQLDMKHARTEWTSDLLNAGGTLNYGKLNDIYLNDNGSIGQMAATTSSQTRYSVGITMRIPISSFFSRYDYKAAKIDLEQTENQKQGLINSIREEVLNRYNSLLSNYETYKILFENFDDQEIILQNAEKDFLTNQISMGDISGIRISYAKAKVDMSKARYEFQKSLWMLEEFTGIKIRE